MEIKQTSSRGAPNNYALIGVKGEAIVSLKYDWVMHRLEALAMAAWIVAVADRGEFEEMLEAVRHTP